MSEPAEWCNSGSLSQFFEATFLIRDHPMLNEKDEAGIDIKSQVKAIPPQNVAGVEFRGTDNLKDHLWMNQEARTVLLYHHNSTLKEYLKHDQ